MKATTERIPSGSAAWISAFRCGCGLLGLVLAGCLDLGPEPVPITYGSITDARDGQVYRTLTVEGMSWMQQDLNFNAPGSICPDTASACALRLYSWSTAMGVDSQFDTTLLGAGNGLQQGVCPVGWHLPTVAEWVELERVMRLPGLPGSNWNTSEQKGFGLKGWYQFGQEWGGAYWIADEFGSGTARFVSFRISYPMPGPEGYLSIEKANPVSKKAKLGIRCLLDGAK